MKSSGRKICNVSRKTAFHEVKLSTHLSVTPCAPGIVFQFSRGYQHVAELSVCFLNLPWPRCHPSLWSTSESDLVCVQEAADTKIISSVHSSSCKENANLTPSVLSQQVMAHSFTHYSKHHVTSVHDAGSVKPSASVCFILKNSLMRTSSPTWC